MIKPFNILIVEDETETWEDYSSIYRKEIDKNIISLDFAATAKDGLTKINDSSKETGLLIIDIILPDLPKNDELFFIESLDKKLKKSSSDTKGILISAHKSIESLQVLESEKDWIIKSFEKPCSLETLYNFTLGKINLSQDKSIKTIIDDIGIDLYDELHLEAKEIKFKVKRSILDAIDAGKRILRVRDKIRYGNFRAWIDTELGFHFTTAQNLMNIAQVFGDDIEKIKEMNVTPSVLYYLATPSTPSQAREKVIKILEEGEKVSLKTTKEIVTKYKKNKSSEKQTSTVDDRDRISTINTNKTFDLSSNKIIEQPQVKQKIVKLIPQSNKNQNLLKEVNKTNKWKGLGRHWVFNGLPNDEDFLHFLPKIISLSIAFPPDKNFSIEELIPDQSRSMLIYYSPFKDFDLVNFKVMVQNSIEMSTEGGENVVFSFLPNYKLLFVADQLECNCIIAEPNLDKFSVIVESWQNYPEF